MELISKWTENQVPDNPEPIESWKMYFGGSLKLEGAGAGVVLTSPKGEKLKYVLQILFPVSNNAAEYEALLHGLRISISLGIQRLVAYGDSMVVISQVNKDWNCSSESMDQYCAEVRKLEGKFQGIEYHQVDRDKNSDAES